MISRERAEAVGLTLAHRAYLYGVFHLVFGSEPLPQTLQSIFSEPTREAWGHVCELLESEELASVAGRPSVAADCTLSQCAAQVGERVGTATEQADDPAFAQQMAVCYARLFQMPGPDYVHPWESPYVGKESMTFQESTLDVRRFYHDAGFRLAAEKRFPDDHIGAMMDYLGRQSMAAYDAFADGDDARASSLLAVQREFLQAHVLTWADAFAAKVAESDPEGLYAVLAAALDAFVRVDEAWLGLVVEELHQ